MTSRSPARELLTIAGLCLAALVVTNGCARLVTVDPESIASYNDRTWKVRRPAGREPLAIVATVPPSSPAAETVTRAPDATAPSLAGVTATPARSGVVPSATVPLVAAPVEPLPFRQRPLIAQALQSAPDDLGVPVQLYTVDPLLAAHRREMESQASARHAVAGGSIVLGLVLGAVAVWAISVGESHQNDPNPDSRSSASQAVVYGGLSGLLGVGEIIAGIAVAASSSDATPLQTYYRETYVDAH
ncbi:MAG TPA: hypothetical protein VGP07_17350 [Polyangia bacterium]|jgi:hypothetical protein